MTQDYSLHALVASTGAVVIGKIIWDWLSSKRSTGTTGTFHACKFTDDYRDTMREMKSMHKDEIKLLKSIDKNIEHMTMVFENHIKFESEVLEDIRDYMKDHDKKLERLLMNSVRKRGEDA